MATDKNDFESIVKKMKYDKLNLKAFNVEETINHRHRDKVLIVKGKFRDSEANSILIFEKTPFPEEESSIQCSILNDKYEIDNIMSNDIYKTEKICGMESLNSIKLTVINPATDLHLMKYRKPKFHFLSETPSMFKNISKPYIEKNNYSIKWIDNLIKKKAEEDRVLIQSSETENGFILALDFKWDGKLMDSLHLLAVVCDYGLRSLRDVNGDHLPLLREIMHKSKDTIEKKYGVPKSQLRLYLHYPPSFYHLHVHITHIHDDSAGALVDRAYLLSSVIHNLELNGNYYQQAILDVSVNENDPLYLLYQSNKCFE